MVTVIGLIHGVVLLLTVAIWSHDLVHASERAGTW